MGVLYDDNVCMILCKFLKSFTMGDSDWCKARYAIDLRYEDECLLVIRGTYYL